MLGTPAKAVFGQAVLLVAIGTAIGVADAFVFRPVTLGRPAPPPISVPTATDLTRVSTKVVIPDPPTAPPQTQQNSCTPTPKDKLPQGHITLDEAKSLFDGGSAVFVDTRANDHYEAGHVQAAHRIELHAFDAGDPPILQMIPRQSAIVCYCIGGNCDESEAVARMLSLAGYSTVYVMHDGFPCWKALGYPFETGPGALGGFP